MASSSQDYYGLLELSRNASLEEIKKSFKRLSLKYHPDKTNLPENHDKFILINTAYETLKSPDKKRVYDLSLGSVPQFTTQSTYSRYQSFRTPFGSGYSDLHGFFAKKGENQRKADDERAKFEAQRLREEMLARQRKEEQDRRRRHQEEMVAKERAEAERAHREASTAKVQAAKDRLNAMSKNPRKESVLADLLKQQKNKEEEIERERILKERLDENSRYRDSKAAAERKARQKRNTDFISQDEFDELLVGTRLERKGPSRPSRKSPHTEFTDKSDKKGPVSQASEHDDDYFVEYVPGQTPPVTPANNPLHGQDSADPIVLDDDEAAEFNRQRKAASTDEAVVDVEEEEAQEAQYEPGMRFTDLNNDMFNNDIGTVPRSEPRIFKKASSPRRTTVPNQSYIRSTNTASSSVPPNSSAKKSKPSTFTYSSINEVLQEKNIEQTDYADMLNSLPNMNGRRKPSGEMFTSQSKRPKVSEYYDGTSQADTLSTPINKNSVRGYDPASPLKSKPLTVFDLHASPSILECKPPAIPSASIDPSISRNGWDRYMRQMNEYHQQFLQYKKLVVQYQSERASKDEELFHEITKHINSDVYQQCLVRDLQVNQEYTEQLRIFTNVMTIYKQNCGWINMRKNESNW